MKCPVCKLENPDIALYCDCGYAFPEGFSRAGKSVAVGDVPAFNHRTEISEDARYIAGRIVKHLWILFFLLPVAIGLLWEIFGAIK